MDPFAPSLDKFSCSNLGLLLFSLGSRWQLWHSRGAAADAHVRPLGQVAFEVTTFDDLTEMREKDTETRRPRNRCRERKKKEREREGGERAGNRHAEQGRMKERAGERLALISW